MKYLFPLVLCLTSYGQLAFAVPPPNNDPCLQGDVVRIERPYFPENPKSPTFKYAFRVVTGTNRDLPAVIYLPGGPGNGSITNLSGIPAEFTAIYTDPRGVGCNKDLDESLINADFFSTYNLASDVLALINFLGLRAYILEGHSYGTVLATIVASRAEREAVAPPVGVTLFGILGHAFRGESPYLKFFTEWQNQKEKLSAAQLQILESPIPPLGLTADQWGIAIATLLMLGPKSASGLPLDLEFLATLLTSENPVMLNAVKEIVIALSATPPPLTRRLYRSIMCQELSSTDNVDFALIKGSLIAPRDLAFCDGLEALKTPYDSANWPIKTPIYYFQGEDDPGTTVQQALYHFRNQAHSKRVFVTYPGSSHILDGILAPCRSAVLRSVAALGNGFEDALSSCSGKPNIDKLARLP